MDTASLVRQFSMRLATPLAWVDLFNDTPEIECFVKDTQGRRIRVSAGIWHRLGMNSEEAMIGKTDHELFPPHIADQYTLSDQEVIISKAPLLGVVEIWINEQGAFDWFITNKYPLFGSNGKVVGIMGTLRKASGIQKSIAPDSPLVRVVNYVREHLHEPSRMPLLSKVAGLSERQLRRRFHQEFGTGLNAFILQARIHAAADTLVRKDTPIAEISLSVGFCDQSAFTRAFKQHMGVTPREYRLQYNKTSSPHKRIREPLTGSVRRKYRHSVNPPD